MAIVSKGKKNKKKAQAVSGKDKLGKVKSKNKLSPATSKPKKKKKKKLDEQEEIIARKKNKSSLVTKTKRVVDDEDSIGDEDEDLDPVDLDEYPTND